MKTLIVLSLILSGCATTGKKEVVGQCIKDYKVVYYHNDVPDWSNPPEGFCNGKNDFPVPMGTALYPLRYKKVSKEIWEHNESWFYVVWSCFSKCNY